MCLSRIARNNPAVAVASSCVRRPAVRTGDDRSAVQSADFDRHGDPPHRLTGNRVAIEAAEAFGCAFPSSEPLHLDDGIAVFHRIGRNGRAGGREFGIRQRPTVRTPPKP